jgi:hypothetical protein
MICVVGGFLAVGQSPDPTKDSAHQIATYFSGHDTQFVVNDVLVTAAALLAVLFGAHLRQVLRAAQPDRAGDVLPLVAFAGSAIFATGLALDDTITIALTQTADKISPTATQALDAFLQNDFVVFGLGLQLLLLSTGIAVVRHAALPRWMGWVAIVLAVLAVTPVGFVAFLGGLLLVAISSVVLALRARAGAGTAAVGSPVTS